MNFFLFNQLVLLWQCLCFVEILGNWNFLSLVITMKDNKFEYTRLIELKEMRWAKFDISNQGMTYHFCTTSDPNLLSNSKLRYALEPKTSILPNTMPYDENQCQDRKNMPVVIKVLNPQQLKNNWNDNNNMELYHSAYMLDTSTITNKSKSDPATIKPEYESWTSKYDSVLGLEIFFHKNSMQTVAIGYKLFSVSLTNRTKSGSPDFFMSISWFKNPSFMNYTKSNNVAKFLEKKLGYEAANYARNDNSDILVASTFAPIEHFPIELWQKPVKTKLNSFPMWNATTEMWKKVTQFSEKVASSIGDLTVTAGITGVMSLPRFQSQQTESHHSQLVEADEKESESVLVLLEDDEEKVKLPNYAWKAFEFNDYGILIVMNCNPFIPTLEKICKVDVCEKNGWEVSNSDFSTGEIYCCDMTAENIKNLQADFTSLTTKKPFVLKTNSENTLLALVESS